ncbi:MAG TPA: glycosyltransferase family 4 protein [Rhizomicrobium sp.]|jgi:glycosyltransferase involved in cell wall biosynthesis
MSSILQVVPALNAGGVERTTIEIAHALKAAGFTPLVASEGGRLEGELAEAGGELIRIQASTKLPHTLIANALRLAAIARERDVKLIHARSRAPAWSALMAARSARVPFVTTYHGIYNAGNPLKRFYNSVMVRADAVIANSAWTAQHILAEHKIDPGKLTVIPRGVDLARFDPAGIPPDAVAALRAEWGAGPDDIVVLLPGRLTRWKGQTVLIEAMARLADPRVHAVLIGDAQGRAAYEAELRNAISASSAKVTLAGHTADMPRAYLAADIVVSASTDPEAFGRVAAEASAMGRPVIATDHGGARETVLPGMTGLLTAPGSAIELAGALAQLLRLDASSLAAMGAHGRAHIVDRYSLGRMCADTLALYRKLIAP